MVDEFDGLFDSNGDDEAYDDGGDVDEEVAPGVGGVVGRVDVEHRRMLLGLSGGFGVRDEFACGSRCDGRRRRRRIWLSIWLQVVHGHSIVKK